MARWRECASAAGARPPAWPPGTSLAGVPLAGIWLAGRWLAGRWQAAAWPDDDMPEALPEADLPEAAGRTGRAPDAGSLQADGLFADAGGWG